MKSFKGSPSGPMVCYSITMAVNPPNAAANVGAYFDIAVDANPGCVVGQRVFANTLEDLSTPGYTLSDFRISATNTVRCQGLNVTTGALNPDATTIALVFLGQREAV